MFDYFKKIPNKKLVALSKQSETKILEDNQMLKQISMALAILCASITITIFPAISEINQPDTTAKEKQIEDSKQSSKIKETNKKKGSHRHGDMRRKGRFGRDEQTRHKSRFEGRRRGISDANYQICLQVYEDQNMTSFGDYVRYYNNHDVIGLVEGIEKMVVINIQKKLDMLKGELPWKFTPHFYHLKLSS